MGSFAGRTSVELAMEADALQRELARRQIQDQLAVNKQYVGKAFVSAGNTFALDYWFVIGLSENGDLDAIRFFRDADGDISVRRLTTYPHMLGKSITRKKWNAEAIGIVTDIRGMLGIGGFAHEQTAPPRRPSPKSKPAAVKNGRRSSRT